jgi:uncharacterized membrane protein
MANEAVSLVLFGTFLIIAGLMLLALKNKGKVEGGALIMIGPLPIVLGSSPRVVKALIILGVALFLIIILLAMVV